MVSEKTYQELKKIKAYMLLNMSRDVKSNNEVVEHIINFYKERELEKWK